MTQEPIPDLQPILPEAELEFGVPFPGEILPAADWAKTALKKLPPPGTFSTLEIFGREAPLILDIGCGNGRSSLILALNNPQANILASDVLPVVIRYATRRGNQRGLHNLRFAVCGGKEFLRDYGSQMNCQQIHCYHPQPYYTRTDIRKRLITPDFLSMVYTSLIDQGQFIIQTDHPSYWNYFEQIIPEFFDFTPHPEPWEDAPLGRTRREILARSQNLPIYRGVATKTKILTPAQLTSLTKKLPWPRFNADRRYQKYDQLERE